MSTNAFGDKSRVYFAQATWGGPIKIGCSYTVDQRIKTLQGPLPFDLVEIGSFPGSRFQEAFLHCYFAEQRIRGEWFQPVPELWRAAMECRTHGRLDWVQAGNLAHCLYLYSDFTRLLSIYRVPLAEFLKSVDIEASTYDAQVKTKNKASLLWLAALSACASRRGCQIGFHDIHVGPLPKNDRPDIFGEAAA